MSNSKGKVFLSHTSSHVTRIQEIAQFLEKNGIAAWYAPRDIQAGKTYHHEITDAIDKMEVMLVYITEDIEDSIFVVKEVETAVSYAKKVIPVMEKKMELPKSIKFLLSGIQWIELEQVGLEGMLNDVLEAYEETKTVADRQNMMLPSPVGSEALSAGIAYAVSDERKALTQKTFVAGPGFQEAEARLTNEHVTVLYHPMHTGKYSAALRLLMEQETSAIFELTSDITPKELYKLPVQNKTGYLLQADASISNWSLQEPVWENWLQKLIEKDAYFCIVTAHQSTNEVLKKYLAKLEAPNQTIEILRKHYEWRYEESLPNQRVKNLTEHLPRGLHPRETVQLVPNVRQFLNGDMDLERLTGSIASVSQKRVESWFDQHENTRDIAMMIAISIFEGESFDVVTEKRDLIEALLDSVPAEKAGYHFHIAEYLQKFHAVERQMAITADYGHDDQTGVFLQFPEDHQYIWRHLWRHLTVSKKQELNEFLLNNIGSKQMQESVLRIYTTLMADDFSFIRKMVVHPLIMSNSTNARMLAIHLLERYMRHTEQYTRVWNLVKSWAGSSSYPLKWSVMLLLKGSIGKIHLEQSIELIQRLVTAEPKLFRSAQGTLGELGNSVRDFPEWEEAFFDSCVGWLAEADKEGNIKVVFKFMEQFFTSHPELFYQSVRKYYRTLWMPFFDRLYGSKTNHALLQRLIEATSASDVNFNLLKKFLAYFKNNASPTARKRMGIYLKQRQWMEVLG